MPVSATRGPLPAWLPAVLVLAVALALLGVIEPHVGADTPRYLDLGRRMLAAWRGLCAEDGCGLAVDTMFPSYALSGAYLSALVRVFALDAPLAVVLANCLCFAGAAWFVALGWRRLCPRAGRSWLPALAMAAYVLLGLPDVLLWSYWILAESLFLLVCAACIVVAALALHGATWRPWLAALALAVTALFVRPTAMVLLPLLLVGILAWRVRGDARRQRRRLWLAAAVAVVLALALVPLLAWLRLGQADLFSPLPRGLRFPLEQVAWFYQHGWVVADQPDTYRGRPDGFLDLVTVGLLRLGYFLLPLKSTFSTAHNVVNGVYLLVTLVAVPLGVARLVRAGDGAVAGWLLLVVLGFALMHAVSVVSYGWRYQLPVMVPWWLLMGIGLFPRARSADPGGRRRPREAAGAADHGGTFLEQHAVEGLSCRPRGG